MSLRLIRAVAETENLDDFHLGRLMVLLGSADGRKTTLTTKARAIEGITKLAKLDFLLRYPTCLERVLQNLHKDPAQANVQERERTSFEAKMIQFQYGPWDSRYRRWLGLLAARRLVTLGVSGNTVIIGLTEEGRLLADRFRSDPLYKELTSRADLVLGAFGPMSATRLNDFVYDTSIHSHCTDL